MASFRRIGARADAGLLARLGLGVAREGKARVVAQTIANRSGTNAVGGERRHDLVSGALADAPTLSRGRFDRPCGVSGEMVAIDSRAFDLMARAGDVAHGVAGFGPYGPETRRQTQCEGEASQAVAVLEGLNVVAEDLVDAALLGLTARASLRAEAAHDEARGLAALARLSVRALADGCADGAAVAARLDAFRAALDAAAAGVATTPAPADA